jgi:catechol 2,3-dioxygenase-like lactoylglutathione lyase family enzyme
MIIGALVAARRTMASVQVRYIVNDVDSALVFYRDRLDFHVVMHPAPAFAMLERDGLRLVLSAPNPGTQQSPGGWNRFAIQVDDIESTIVRLRDAGARFRNQIVSGVSGRQIIVEDPSGNPVELFEPRLPESRL